MTDETAFRAAVQMTESAAEPEIGPTPLAPELPLYDAFHCKRYGLL
jgi:hypothetical protein